MSERFDCTTPEGRADGIAAAGAAVRRGEVIVLPTDTVYGIGCDAFDPDAVTAVLAAKGRGRDMPPPVLIPTARTAQGLAAEIPGYAATLMERFWPGPLTVVLKAHMSLQWDLGDTNGTVALRMPAHEVALELLADTGPLAVTSANSTGAPAARTVDQAQNMLGDAVAVYLDGGIAGDEGASTIIDCTGPSPVTLRHGALAQASIDAALEPDQDDGPAPEMPAPEAAAPEAAAPEAAAPEAAAPESEPVKPESGG